MCIIPIIDDDSLKNVGSGDNPCISLKVTMPYGVISLCQPTTNTDGALLKEFFPDSEVLVIAHGSLLQFYKINDDSPILIVEYQVFGDIARVIPLRHPQDTQANLLVLLSDYRFSILRVNNGEITTVQSGDMKSSVGVEIDPPFRIAVSPKALCVQICQTTIQYYRISPYSRLLASFNCPVCCKSIIDFGIMCVDDICVRLIVLYETFTGGTKMQAYESDESMQTFTPKSNFTAGFESDVYFIKVINESTVIALSTNIARKVHFIVTSSPQVQSSTIYTMAPIISMCKMKDDFYLTINENGEICVLRVLPNAIDILKVSEISNAAALIRYNDKCAIAIGSDGTSSMIHIDDSEYPPKLMTNTLFESSGSIRQIIPVGSSQVDCLCAGRYAAHLTREIQLSDVAQMPFPGCQGIWLYRENVFVATYGGKTVAAEFNEEGINPTVIPDLADGQTLAFHVTEGGYIQVTREAIVYETKSIVFKKRALSCSINGRIATVTFDDKINIYIDGEVKYSFDNINTSNAASDLAGERFAFVSWSQRKVTLVDKESKVLKQIEDIPAVAAFFDQAVLVIVLECDDIITVDMNLVEKRVQCPGLHTGVCPTPRGFCISGETPVMFVGGAMWTLSCSGFTQASLLMGTACIVSNNVLTIYSIGNTEPEVRCDLIDDEINFCVRTPNNEFIQYLATGELCVAQHPLKPSENRINPDEKSKFISMAVLEHDGKMLLGAIFGNKLKLYQIIHGCLERRSDYQLHEIPFSIVSFGDSFIVAFPDSIELLGVWPVSLSEIKLKQITTYQTLGASCCISAEGDTVVIGDQLQSVSLIEYNRKNEDFVEIARNSIAMSVVKVLISNRRIFGLDDFGALFEFRYSDFHNTTVNELVLAGSYAICSTATSIAAADNGLIIIGTKEGQLVGVIEIPEEAVRVFQLLESNMETVGQFSPETHRLVMHNNFGLPCPTMVNLDLAILYLKLPQTVREEIAKRASLSLQEVDDICKKVLDIAYM